MKIKELRTLVNSFPESMDNYFVFIDFADYEETREIINEYRIGPYALIFGCD